MTINGKKIAEEVLFELKNKLAGHKKLNLAAVLVGEHAGSKKFLELKQKVAEKIGAGYRIYEFPVDITTEKLAEEVSKIAQHESNHGVLIELPLPATIDTQKVLNQVPQEKDVDVLSESAQGAFFSGQSKILPPAVEATRLILENYFVDVAGKNCVVFGYGLLVGRQVSHWLARQKATVTIINELTVDAKYFSQNADIIISGVGKPGLITADMVKEGAILIDFGYENPDGRIVGDIDFDNVSPKAKLITSVPGGVGPLVIATVLENLIVLNQ